MIGHPVDSTTPPGWLFAAFPFLFVGMWLTITTVLGFMSGWFSLQQRYPKGSDEPLRRFLMKSGSMGIGGGGGPFSTVSMGGILNISPCPNGLRVGIFRLFGLFQRPFEVPWQEVRVERSRMLFLPRAKLTFGNDEGTMWLDVGLWNRVAGYAPEGDRARLSVEPIEFRALAGGLLLAWAVITIFLGTFFVVTSRLGPGAPLPVLQCYAMPAVLAGIAMFFFWIRQLR